MRCTRIKQLARKAYILAAQMEELKKEADEIVRQKSIDEELELEAQFSRMKIDVYDRRMRRAMASSIDTVIAETGVWEEKKNHRSDGSIQPTSPILSPMSVRNDWPDTPNYAQNTSLSSLGTDIGDWSSIASDINNYAVAGGSSSSSSSSNSETEAKQPKKRRNRRQILLFTENDLDRNELCWVGRGKTIFHSVKCPHNLKKKVPGELMTIGLALDRGYRLPKGNGGCCRAHFVQHLAKK